MTKTAESIIQPIFGDNGFLEKSASIKSPEHSWETAKEIKEVIKTLTPEKRKNNAYVLVNALGAGEYFDSNINADYFEWNMLCHKGFDYGYMTFLNAHAFAHHKNKEPEKSMGKPIWSGLHHQMKRVELIIEINKELAAKNGHDGILTRVEAGDFIDVSMGTRVPYDVCSICHHESKTTQDYCQHMRPPPELMHKYGPNKILPDGRRIFVYNPHPRFFDISFVFVGADKTAKVMAKLASKGQQSCIGDVCAIPTGGQVIEINTPVKEEPVLQKVASVQDCGCEGYGSFAPKTASHRKLSEIIKSVPANTFSARKLPHLESSEESIPQETLDSFSEMPLKKLLSGLLGLGTILKPAEFQNTILNRMGEKDLAYDLLNKNKIFAPSEDFDSFSLDPSTDSSREILPSLKGLLRNRSIFSPGFKIRIMTISNLNNSLPNPEEIKHPTLDKISSAYNGYRRSALIKISQAAKVVSSDYHLREAVLEKGVVDLFSKTASENQVIDLDSISYMISAHLKDRGQKLSSLVSEELTEDLLRNNFIGLET